MFSVLIANYNNWKYFKDCFESLQQQSFQDFEVVILDDCSSDDSYAQLLDFARAHPEIRLYQNETNQGVGATKDRLVHLAKGAFCAFLDPDDAVFDDAIAESQKVFTKFENVIATYSQIMLCDEALHPVEIYKRSRAILNGKKDFFNINNEVSHFFAFRKSAYLKTAGINPSLSSAVDFDLYLKLYEVGDFHFIKKPLYRYRLHQGGISQNKAKKKQLNLNWNRVLFDTCQRREIEKIGNTRLTPETDLRALIFQKENTFLSKLKRKIVKS